MTINEIEEIEIGDMVYYARFLPSCGVSEILELHVNNYDGKVITGLDKKTKQMFLISKKYFEERLFFHRDETLKALKKLEKDNNYKEKNFTVQLED